MSAEQAAPKLRKVSPSKWDDFPVPAGTLVQVTRRDPDKDRQTLTVYLDGKDIGKLETSMFTERVPIAPGKRIGRDLKPRRVWYQDAHHRLKYDRLARGVLEVIRDHQAGQK
jgi:hypothetical protein